MPKNSKSVKTDGIIRKFRVPHKLRIGFRETGVSALHMSTDALKAVLVDPNKTRWYPNARAALKLRGATV